MALPIKPTPILEGKAAERFLKEAENPKKASKKERDRIYKITKMILNKNEIH